MLLSVSSLTNQIKNLLETTFLHVNVCGEVSRPTYHTSGHLYFTLKDENSSISCVMFKGNNQKLKFKLEEGMSVELTACLSVYSPRGTYQLNCLSINPSGAGELSVAYEQLKKEFAQKGYFDQKRPLPKFPRHVALITSKTGAALQDMLNVAKKRYPLVKLTLIDTLVQGEMAKYSIANAIKKANALEPDIIVLSRGGGSVEDLWAFNEPEVAKALFESKVPSICAVGHAIDTSLSDFVADANAPTPSACMEQILPDINELKIFVDNMQINFENIIKHQLNKHTYRLEALFKQMQYFSPKQKISDLLEQNKNTKKLFYLVLSRKFELSFMQINALFKAFHAHDLSHFVAKGYAQILKNNKPTNPNLLKKDDIFDLQTDKKTFKAKII